VLDPKWAELPKADRDENDVDAEDGRKPFNLPPCCPSDGSFAAREYDKKALVGRSRELEILLSKVVW